jgi:PHD/YefM family antitoxin component YafN of YafNO toxin-antitoxin module
MPTRNNWSKPVITISSREFNQQSSEAKKASLNGPVFITDRGRPAHVLLTMQDYLNLKNSQTNIWQQLSLRGIEEIELDLPKSKESVRAVSFD